MNATETNELNEFKEIELIDIEDIVPIFNSNSLFLCVARTLIYISHRNESFIRALEECCAIKRDDLKTDIYLQAVLRSKLCDYIMKSAISFKEDTRLPYLKDDFANYFQNNIYDFLIQLYQLSINNFSSNQLYSKFAIKYLSNFLNMRICLKKTNGKWKFYEPTNKKNLEIGENRDFKSDLISYLNDTSIYLYEFKVSSNRSSLSRLDSNNNKNNGKYDIRQAQANNNNNNNNNNKIIRILLNKRLWLKNYHENSKICMRFSQFCDPDELNKYNQCKCLIDSLKLLHLYKNACHLSLCSNPNYLLSTSIIDDFKKIFFAFILCSPVDLLINCERDSFHLVQQQLAASKSENKTSQTNFNELLNEIYLSPKYDTIGKQFQRFEIMSKSNLGKEKLLLFLNHLLGKKQFNDEYINNMYKYLLKEFNILKQTNKVY